MNPRVSLSFLLKYCKNLAFLFILSRETRNDGTPDNKFFNIGDHPTARAFFRWTHYGFSIAVMHSIASDLDNEVTS